MTERPPSRPPPSPGPNLSLGDVYYVVFRHKWKILLITGAGMIGSLLLPFIKKVPYTSEAKLYIRYVLESSSPTPDASDPRIKLPDTRGESIINTELEILTSLDLAQQVADLIGAEKIVGTGRRDRFEAAAAVRKGLAAEVPKNSCVIRVAFQHANPEIVQPVLQQLIELYLKKHTEIHAVGAFDDFLTQETDQLRSELSKTEQELGRAKTNLGFYASLEDAKRFQGEEISRIRQTMFEAEAELAESKAAVNEFAGLFHASPNVTTNKVTATPAEKLAEYRRITSFLDALYAKEQEESRIFTPESVKIKSIRQQMADNAVLKAQMEKQYPELLVAGVPESRRTDGGSNPRGGLTAETTRVTALNSKIAVLNEQLERLQQEAAAVGNAEGAITKLQLQKEIEEGRYRHFVKGLEQARIDEKIGSGKVSNIGAIQRPSPPFRDVLKLQKMRLAVAVAGFAFAVGLAFILEMFVDRSIKNAAEIEGKLGLPLFLAVPCIHENGNGLSLFKRIPLLKHRNDHASRVRDLSEGDSALAPEGANTTDTLKKGFSTRDSQLQLRPFFEALRDRLIGFFEIKGLSHKPKLVAVTSCRDGSGVSTFASGLAASLSETGDGNVLLVDMSQQSGNPKHFFERHLNCGLEEALENEKRNAAFVQDNLYVVSESRNGNESGNGNALATERKLTRVLPKRFTNLMPKLKASDYDYIIFDMPPVDQLSVTPRIAKFMDIVLLVIESEKTDRDIARRAITLLAESKPNLGAVLNKRRSYVPNFLHQEL